MKAFYLLIIAIVTLSFISCSKSESTNDPTNTDITVTAVAPTSGNAGTKIIITGTNFGTDKTTLVVKFGTVTATVDSVVGGIMIYTKVPDGLTTGDNQLSVNKATITKNITFKVLDAIVGKWLCEGLNVPYGLRVAPFKVIKIVATFNENKSYTVVQTDSSNVNTTFSGTYTGTATTYTDTMSANMTKGAIINDITANQSSPSTITAQGIFAIKSTFMTYEVIQVNPPLAGVNPPTAAAGFGSTSIAGIKYPIYIQRYVKQ